MNTQQKTYGHEVYQFGFRIPFLPDFLLDHTLLEKEPHERIAEHCRRWTQFIAGLWREEDITFALVYEWNPQPKSIPSARADSIEITLLGCAARGRIADEIIDTLACALRAFGFAPERLSDEDVSLLKPLRDGEVFEVRQRDTRVELDVDYIRRHYSKELDAATLRQIEHGVYAVLPWWGAGGTHLFPFHSLVAQGNPVAIWILLRPVALNEITNERGWLMKWARLLAKWSEDNGSRGDSTAETKTESTTTGDSNAKTEGANKTATDSVSSGKDRSKILGFDGSISSGKGHSTAETLAESKTITYSNSKATGTSVTVTQGAQSFSARDPQAKWFAEEITAFTRKLNNPFYVTVYCFSDDISAARTVANSITSAINEEMPFDAQQGETSPRRSSAEFIKLEKEQKRAAVETCRTLIFEPDKIQSSPNLRVDEPKNLNYIADARAASTVFRFPVNTRGGIPGIQVKQQAPNFHPGAIYSTVPDKHISLGKLGDLGMLSLPVEDFKKHALITGFTGSGKTVTVLNLLHQFWIDCSIPFLVIESAKQEYRGLLNVDGFDGTDNLRVYTLGNEVCAPFRFNPFELLPGVRVEAHISKLQTCFEGALPPIGPLASLIYEALLDVYRQKGWQLTDHYPRNGEKVWRSFPTMTDFARTVEELIGKRGYQGEMRNNLTAAIAGRIKPLILGSKGKMFDTQHSNPIADELFNIPTILELNDLNQDDKALVVMFLLTMLREYREIMPAADGKLKHITVVEEAHNVLENVQSTGLAEGGSADTRYKAVQAFCNMLAEIRALGEGLIIADQSPEKLAPDAMRNTNVQIAHQLRDSSDREAIAKAMIMDEEQRDFLGKLETGNAAVFVTGLQKATFIKVPQYYPSERDKTILKRDENRQARKLRLQKVFRGYGFGPVGDERLKSYMNDLTKRYHQLSVPFDECKYCQAQGCYRDSMFVQAQDDKLKKQFKTAFSYSNPEYLGQSEERHQQYWKKMVTIANSAARQTGHPSDVDAAWCFYIHAWHNESAETRKAGGPLTLTHRKEVEKAFSYLLKKRG
ncbi:MAG TPA: hypothetical protein VF735_21370 [Pyrinomonadaceae bacterium]|jgi:hypothetical protein